MQGQTLDWIGFVDQFAQPPRRIISLVPSVTESLFDLNIGETVVGVTDYCVHPREKVANLPKVGGTKNPQVEKILALNPDLVIANREENTKQVVSALAAAGVSVWVTFPKSVDESIDLLRGIARLFKSKMALQQVEMLEIALEWAEAAAADQDPVPYFCPIWQELVGEGEIRWMTFNRETYCHDLLARLGGRNVFQDRARLASQTPGTKPDATKLFQSAIGDVEEEDTRYPRITVEEVVAAQPELILLPDEPFGFSDEHEETLTHLLVGTPAVKYQNIKYFEGSLLTWHGTRLALALQTIPGFFQSIKR
jgi:ABC-type Fe3+-hydroxamate transport system substrate-binding protein